MSRDAELEEAMRVLRQHGNHVARTVHHDGATSGVLFLEDVLEVVVGEVNDATVASRPACSKASDVAPTIPAHRAERRSRTADM